MKGNRKARKQRNDQAEVGIGTMIVFIAAVIVAAIAAAVLVNTAGNLQRKSQETGEETTQQVSGNLFVRDTMGEKEDSTDTDTADDKTEHVAFYVALAPGAEPVDLNQTILRWSHETNHTTLETKDTDSCSTSNTPFDPTAGNGEYCVERLEQPSGDSNYYLLSEGDLVKIHVFLEDKQSFDQDIDTRTDVSAVFVPDSGAPTDASFSTPASYGGDSWIQLS